MERSDTEASEEEEVEGGRGGREERGGSSAAATSGRFGVNTSSSNGIYSEVPPLLSPMNDMMSESGMSSLLPDSLLPEFALSPSPFFILLLLMVSVSLLLELLKSDPLGAESVIGAATESLKWLNSWSIARKGCEGDGADMVSLLT